MFGSYVPGKLILRKIIDNFFPPDKWRFPVAAISAIFIGLVLFILYISNAVSYLSDDPKVCINCHVMNPQYATWQTSSHAGKATCNDCHVPHDSFVRKYFFKANDGLRHATIYTLRLEPQVIRIKEAGAGVVQENCIRCHSNKVHDLAVGCITFAGYKEGEGLLCYNCHADVPHGRVNGLASVPYARVPGLSPVLPDWLEKYVSSEKSE
jgi:cytochrome c nitrite reductase small subunit